MTTITKTMKTKSGKIVDLNISVENAKVTGIATSNGLEMAINGTATVQGRKVLVLKNAPANYLPIEDALFVEIEKIAKAQYVSQMTPLEIAEGKMREAEVKYNKLANQGWDNIATIKARDEWDRLSGEYHNLSAK